MDVVIGTLLTIYFQSIDFYRNLEIGGGLQFLIGLNFPLFQKVTKYLCGPAEKNKMEISETGKWCGAI